MHLFHSLPPAPGKSQDYSEASCTAGWEDASTLKSPTWNKVVCEDSLTASERTPNMFSLLELKYNTMKKKVLFLLALDSSVLLRTSFQIVT